MLSVVLSSLAQIQLVLAELQLTVFSFCLLLSFVLPHLFLAERVPFTVLTLLVWTMMHFELPSNHLLQAEPMSATDYKLLTATLDPFSESSGATFFIPSSYPAS